MGALNKAAVENVVYVPTGFYLGYQAWRKNVSGVDQRPATRSPGACPRPDPQRLGRPRGAIPYLTAVARWLSLSDASSRPSRSDGLRGAVRLLRCSTSRRAIRRPSSPATRRRPADVERIRSEPGARPAYLVRFGEWLFRVLQGDLGTSIFTSLPVTQLIAQRIEPTVSLMVLTLIFAVVIAVPMGVIAAWKAGTWIDKCAMAFAVLGFSVPVFVVGYLLAYDLRARSSSGCRCRATRRFRAGFWPWLSNLILPAVTLGFVYIALIARITRATMLEVLQQDYVRTARSKGVGQQKDVLFLHCAEERRRCRSITIIGIGIALLIGGAVVTESVFAIPGLGRLTVDAILRRDYPVIQGVVLMFSLVYVLVNLLIDLDLHARRPEDPLLTAPSSTDNAAGRVVIAEPVDAGRAQPRCAASCRYLRRHPSVAIGGGLL